MAKIDSLKEKINILRDDYRHLFIFFMAIITGSFTIFFQVITNKLNLLYSFIGLIGLVIDLFILIKIQKIKFHIDILIREFKGIDE